MGVRKDICSLFPMTKAKLRSRTAGPATGVVSGWPDRRAPKFEPLVLDLVSEPGALTHRAAPRHQPARLYRRGCFLRFVFERGHSRCVLVCRVLAATHLVLQLPVREDLF